MVKREVILPLIISSIKAGKNPTQISQEQNIKKQTLNYYLRQLKEKGIITKESYGVWKVLKEVPKSTKGHTPHLKKQIRGHAFIWRVKFKHDIDWVRRLKENKVNYQMIGINNSTPRIMFNDRKIWLTKNGAVIYEPHSFFSKSSHTSKGMAVYELDKTIKQLGIRLKINLAPYSFKTSREHYGMIKNELARQYNSSGEKLMVRDDKGNGWLWIDDSESLNELETNEPVVSKQVQNWHNDNKKHGFTVTSSFILNTMHGIQQNQSMFAENMSSHIEAIKTLGSEVKNLSKVIKKERKDMRRAFDHKLKEFKSQKRINEYF